MNPLDNVLHRGTTILLCSCDDRFNPTARFCDAYKFTSDEGPVISGNSEEEEPHVHEVEACIGNMLEKQTLSSVGAVMR